MNRKTFIIFLLIAALVIFGSGSCLSNKMIDKDHNARNSLDWDGVYTGTIPSASGPGIDVRLRLNNDQSFELNYKYLDRTGSPVNWTGSFKWDDTGSIITLDVIDAPPHYRVAQNKLTQLDMKGKRISGKLADNYVLNKER
jgi:uncharacterized lipoprotein NlpE involved in copper resistance